MQKLWILDTNLPFSKKFSTHKYHDLPQKGYNIHHKITLVCDFKGHVVRGFITSNSRESVSMVSLSKSRSSIMATKSPMCTIFQVLMSPSIIIDRSSAKVVAQRIKMGNTQVSARWHASATPWKREEETRRNDAFPANGRVSCPARCDGRVGKRRKDAGERNRREEKFPVSAVAFVRW